MHIHISIKYIHSYIHIQWNSDIVATLGQAQTAAISEWPLYPTYEGLEGKWEVHSYIDRYSISDIIEEEKKLYIHVRYKSLI